MTDDRRQTDHTTEKRVAIGGIACARAIPHNNANTKYKVTEMWTIYVFCLLFTLIKYINNIALDKKCNISLVLLSPEADVSDVGTRMVT